MPVRQFAAGRWRAVACVTLYREIDLKPGFALIFLTAVCLGLVKARGAGFSGFEGRQIHPIALSRDGARLFALNAPAASLSIFNVGDTKGGVPILIEEIPVGLEPVSLAVRDEDEVWVVNEVSDSISVVSLRRGAVVATLACPDEPADIVFSGGMAFVSCARSRRVRVFDAATRQPVAEIPLEGMSPMAMAVGADGGSVYVAFHESGNGTAILPAALAPPQPPPDAAGLPAAPDTALIVGADDPRLPYRVLDRDVVEISVRDLRVVRYYGGVGTGLHDLAVRPGNGELWIANTDARNGIAFEPRLRGHVVDNRVTRLALSTGSLQAYDLNPGVDYSKLPDPDAVSMSVAIPTAVVFEPNGDAFWTAGFSSDRLARVSAVDGSVLQRVDVRGGPSDAAQGTRPMRGPRGLTFDERRGRLYVANKLANTVSVVEVGAGSITAEVPIGSHDPTPANVRKGRELLFDARLSGNGNASCASCHLDADHDGLAWDLGDPDGAMQTVLGANLAVHDTAPQPRLMHPMKGPMRTQTLRGVAMNAPLHWRGDRAGIRDFKGTFAALLGGTVPGDEAMDGLAAYLSTLRHHPNPNRTLQNVVPKTLDGADPVRGQALFNAHIHHCGVCHTSPTGSDGNIDDPRNFGGLQPIKTPPLQTVYQRMILDTRAGATNFTGFGLLHDGAGGMQSLPTVHFYELDLLGPSDFAHVAAFLRCFDSGTAPAVGFSRTATVSNAASLAIDPDLGVMESEASISNRCDLLVRGRIGGRGVEFWFNPETGRYQGNATASGGLARTELLGRVQHDDAITFLGVPPGMGALLLRFEMAEPPSVRLAASDTGWNARWTAPVGDWVIESAESVGGPWLPGPYVVGREGPEFQARIDVRDRAVRFIRLRRTW